MSEFSNSDHLLNNYKAFIKGNKLYIQAEVKACRRYVLFMLPGPNCKSKCKKHQNLSKSYTYEMCLEQEANQSNYSDECDIRLGLHEGPKFCDDNHLKTETWFYKVRDITNKNTINTFSLDTRKQDVPAILAWGQEEPISVNF